GMSDLLAARARADALRRRGPRPPTPARSSLHAAPAHRGCADVAADRAAALAGVDVAAADRSRGGGGVPDRGDHRDRTTPELDGVRPGKGHVSTPGDRDADG